MQRAFCGSLLLAASQAYAADVELTPEERYRAPAIGDLGGTGILQIPTARFSPDGEFVPSVSSVFPYTRYSFTAQIIPDIEAVFRYTDVENRLFGPREFSGDQSFKDRGFDFKFKLFDEGKYRPAAALGFRDIGGTGLFSSEYLVFNKRYYDLDFTWGVGWGQLGTQGNIKNPLASISDVFKTRDRDVGQGGTIGNVFFRGETIALFGGLTYKTPVDNLTFLLEYDGNDYQSEALQNNQEVDSPFNIGLLYQPYRWLDIKLGYERGNQVLAQFSVRNNLNEDLGLPKYEDPPQTIIPRGQCQACLTPSKALFDAISKELSKERIALYSIDFTDNEITAYVSQGRYRSIPKALGRAARVIASFSPPQAEFIRLINVEGGLSTFSLTLKRKELEKAVNYNGSVDELWITSDFSPGEPWQENAAYVAENLFPNFSWSFSPAMRQQVGGPDGFVFFQIWARFDFNLGISRGLSLNSTVGLNLYSQFGDIRLESDSVLPRVRSNIVKYLQQGENNLVRLEMNYLWKPYREVYARMSAGIFEEMFGGVGGEVLYKPFGSRFSIGADLNYVKQRTFEQLFEFQDYSVVTGHVNAYYKFPFENILGSIHVGRYLAGDHGITFEFSKEFQNGTRIGAFASFTDVSAEDFGEGSFDKGFFLNIPLDLFLTRSKRSRAGFTFRPTTRDGGQRLNISRRLYEVIRDSSPDELENDWGSFLD